MTHYRSQSTSGIPSSTASYNQPSMKPRSQDDGDEIILGKNRRGEIFSVNSQLINKGENDGMGDIVVISPVSVHMPDDELDMGNKKNNPNSYLEEWKNLFGGEDYLTRLKTLGLNGQLRSCRFRSICWKLYLDCLPEETSEWLSKVREQRSKYQSIMDQLSKNPRLETDSLDLSVNNPLSQEEQSPWNQYFQDSELKVTISQDVIRTFPEIDFFHTTQIQDMMVNVLFCFAREHPHITYKQGMHELLAPLIFVLHSDQQAFLHASEIGLLSSFDSASRDELKELLDPKYIEYDAYFMFSQVMEAVESWYLVNDTFNTKSDCFNSAPFSRPPECGPSSSLGVKLMKIHEQLLQRHDVELFSHLVRMEIVPQIFGIRWLRLLFGREFAMQDLLVIWDAIFADSLSFDLVDYIFTAMLIFIRDLLLSSDYTACLSYLMRYPPVVDVHYIIDLALHLRNPVKYSKPAGYTSHGIHIPSVGGQRDIHRAPLRHASSNAPHGRGVTPPTASDSVSKGPASLVSDGVATTATKTNSLGRPRTLAVSPFGTLRLVGKNAPKSSGSESAAQVGNVVDSPDAGSADAVEIAVSAGHTPPCKLDLATESSNWSTGHVPGHTRRLSDITAQMRTNRNFDQPFGGPDGSDQLNVNNHMGKLDSLDFSLHRSAHLSLSLGQLNSDKDKMGKEMVRLPAERRGSLRVKDPEAKTHLRATKHTFKELEEELAKLKTEMSERQVMMDYCWRRMTHHLEQLQECMLRQRLEHEDEMLLSLAGLKRVRDILKGNLRFSEVTDDDDFVIMGTKNLNIGRDDESCHSSETDIPNVVDTMNSNTNMLEKQQQMDSTMKNGAVDESGKSGGGLAVARRELQKLKNTILPSD